MKSKNENINWFPLIILFLIVAIFWGVSWYLLVESSYLAGWEDRGTFGDMFGSINALFSGLAFAGVIYAIFLQRKELFLQRKELEQTRDELEGQKIQLQMQNENIRLQRFETTFFNLVTLHHAYIEKLSIPGFGNNQGRNSFDEFDSKYTNIVKSNVTIMNLSNFKKKIIEANKIFRKDYPNYLDIYARNVLNILNFIEKTDNIDKSFYSNFFKSQLSNVEIKFLHFFSIDDFYGNDFKPLIDKYEVTTMYKDKYKFE